LFVREDIFEEVILHVFLFESQEQFEHEIAFRNVERLEEGLSDDFEGKLNDIDVF
jgi:hypothetical protein